jgi:hypothetical protein
MVFFSLRRLVNRLSLSPRRGRRMITGRPGNRLGLEQLEDRLVPATINFTNFEGGAWETPGNRNNGAGPVPGPGDTAVIAIAGLSGPNRVTYSSDNPPVAGLTLSGRNSTLDVQGGTLRVTSGALAISNAFTASVRDGGTLIGQTTFTVNGAMLNVYGGTVSAPNDNLTVQGGSTLTLHGGSVPFTTTLISSTLDLGDSSTTGAGAINARGACTLVGSIGVGQMVRVQGYSGGNSQLTVAAGTTNAGTVVLDNIDTTTQRSATLAIPAGGTFTNLPGGVIRSIATVVGGRFITGYLVNQGLVDVAANARLQMTGTCEAAGGTIQGPGAVVNGQVRVSAPPTTGTDTTIALQGACTLVGDNLANTTLAVQGTSSGNSQLTVTAGTTNAGTIVLDNIDTTTQRSATLAVSGGGTLTNAPGGAIRSVATVVGGRFITGELINAGTLAVSNTNLVLGSPGANHVSTGSIQLSNGTLTVMGASFTNQTGGVITGSGTINTLVSGGALFTNQGTIRVPAGNTLVVTGSFRNFSSSDRLLTGGTYEVTGILQFDGANIVTNAATIALFGTGSTGGQIRPTGGTTDALAGFALNIAGGSLAIHNRNFGTSPSPVASFSNSGVLEIDAGSTFYVRNFTQGAQAELNVDGGRMQIQGTFANFAGGTLTGGLYRLRGTDATNRGTLQFNGADIVTNAAAIELDGPTAEIIDLASPLPNDGLRNFAVNDTAGSFTLGQGRNFATARDFTNNGTLAIGAGSTFTVSGSLTNVSGNTLTGGTWFIAGTLQYTGDDIRTNAATVVFDGAGSIVNGGGNALANLALNAEAGSFTVQNGRVFTLTADFRNAGLLTVGAGGTFQVTGQMTGSFTQDGTAVVLAGGVLRADHALTNFDPATGTLNGGTYRIAGSFRFAGADIRTNAATVVLDASGSIVNSSSGADALTNFAANADAGSLTLQNGANLTMLVNFSNAGTLAIGSGSTFIVAGAFTQSGGATTLASGAMLEADGVTLLGGTLSGSGTIMGNVVNAASILVGDATTKGTLTIMGDYTQTATGNLTVKVGGTAAGQYDQLLVSGSATLDGTLTVTLVDNYTPVRGDPIPVLTSTSESGTFAHPLGGDGPLFTDNYSDTGVVLVAN